MRCCVVFLTLISWGTWACNLVQSSQQGCVSPSKVTSATLVLALKVSQCPFQLSQAISSQKISVVLGNTGVRKCEGGCPAAGLGATLWEPAPVQHPLYFSECPVFPSGAPTSTWQCHTGDTMDSSPPQGNLGVESLFRGFDAFLSFPGEGRTSGRRGLGTSGTGASLGLPGAPGHPMLWLCFAFTVLPAHFHFQRVA